MASKPTLLTTTRELHVAMTLAGHGRAYHSTPDGGRPKIEDYSGPNICYFPDGQQMISGSADKTTRLWDLRTGKESKEARVVNEHRVDAVAVSRDGRWVITVCVGGEVKACEVKTGIVKIFEDRPDGTECIDISVGSKLLASGSSDGTMRIWSLGTGKLVAGPFKCAQIMNAVRFSRNSKMFVATSWQPDTGKGVTVKVVALTVWDIEAQKMNSRIVQFDRDGGGKFFSSVPVFWTMEDRTIVGVFSHPDVINELDASTLGTIGAPFKGHTEAITCFDISFDCAFLVSASAEGTIKFWAFESRQLITSFNFHSTLHRCILSPDARKVALTVYGDAPHKIYICDVPPDILADVSRSHKEAISTNLRIDALDVVATTHPAAVHSKPATASLTTSPSRHSPTIHQQPTPLRHLRKLLPFSFRGRDAVLPVRNDRPRDPLDCPATSPGVPSHLSPATITQLEHTTVLPISESSTSTTIRFRLVRQLSNWWPMRTGNALPPIVEVSLAPGRLRHAAAGASIYHHNHGDVSDEEVDSRPPSPNLRSIHLPAEEHGRGRLCGCF